ncbi:MAG: nuclear transport factor 2 family protein [Novosphingobium sp.]
MATASPELRLVASDLPQDLTPACRAAKEFLECLNTQDAKRIRGLLANEVQMVGPDGRTLTDPAEFEAIEEQGFNNMEQPWRFELVNLLPFGSHGCLMEFTVASDSEMAFRPGAIDHFEVDDEGKIVRFIPYIAASWVNNAVENISKHKR